MSLFAPQTNVLIAERRATIRKIVAACQSCCDFLDSLPADDTIVAALRQPDTDTSAAPDVPSGNTIAPTLALEMGEEMEAPRGASTKVAGQDADQWKLPPELRDDRRYRIVELLGHGGMGDVYRAEHKVMNRQESLAGASNRNSPLPERAAPQEVTRDGQLALHEWRLPESVWPQASKTDDAPSE
jgi:hypothetical protein